MPKPSSPASTLRALLIRSTGLSLAILLTACANKAPEERPSVIDISRREKESKIKYLCIFMDGTDNNFRSQTHVRRLFEIMSAQRNPNVVCYYDTGVGAENNRLMGLITGRGFTKNVVEAYAFLGRNY